MAVALTARTQKVHWKMSSMVSRWKSNLLRASLFSKIMLADAMQYARPGKTCDRRTSKSPQRQYELGRRKDSEIGSGRAARMCNTYAQPG